MIYVVLRGRIGNQLFMYAYAHALRLYDNEPIIIDDSYVLKENWENSLMRYSLANVKFVHKKQLFSPFFKQILMDLMHQKIIFNMDYIKKFDYQVQKSQAFSKHGLITFENGFYSLKRRTKNVLIDGCFQSEKFFMKKKELLLRELAKNNEKFLENYKDADLLKKRNSVCISIKIEHNVGSSLYHVCTKEYWMKAIRYITENVENPLFFICSDNIDYVCENLIDCNKYDVVFQDSSVPVNVSLAAMALCKHFIIGNTSFGWWAQYMSTNPSKIVIAPSKWMNVDMPIDIYQDNWKIIEV